MDLKFADTLPQNVLDELTQLTAKLKQYLYSEHNQDGKHATISPDHLTLQGAKVGEFIDLPYDASRFGSFAGTWTVDAIDVGHMRFCRIGQLVYFQFRLTDTFLSVASSSSLYIRLPELNMYPSQDQDGFNDQMGGMFEVEDADGIGHGFVTVGTDNPGSAPATFLILQKYNASTFALRNFQTGGITMMGSLMFMVNQNNTVKAFG